MEDQAVYVAPFVETVTSLNGTRRQGLFVDLSFWCRTGGTDWAKLRDNCDGVIIRAGQGYYGYDELLHEHVDMANRYGVPYATYWQSDSRQDAIQQGRLYAKGYGVQGHHMFLAHEYTGGGLIAAPAALMMHNAVEDAVGEKTLGYSRTNIIVDAWGKPGWLTKFDWWIARYPYDLDTKEPYKYFYKFIAQRAWLMPAGIPAELKDKVLFWQFTKKLDARRYFANPTTNDPKAKTGLISGDGNVTTTMTAEEFIVWLGGVPVPPPPAELTDSEKLDRLWKAHPELH